MHLFTMIVFQIKDIWIQIHTSISSFKTFCVCQKWVLCKFVCHDVHTVAMTFFHKQRVFVLFDQILHKRIFVSACNQFRCTFKNEIKIFIFNIFTKMVLNVFVIMRKHLFWIIDNLSHVFSSNLSIKLCQIIDTYVITDRIIVEYICHALTKNTLQIETMILDNIMHCVIIFIWMNLIWKFYFNLKSICKSNTQTCVLKIMIMSLMFIITVILNFFVFCDKWINSYFFNVKTMSCRFVYYTQTSCIFFNATQFIFVDLS